MTKKEMTSESMQIQQLPGYAAILIRYDRDGKLVSSDHFGPERMNELTGIVQRDFVKTEKDSGNDYESGGSTYPPEEPKSHKECMDQLYANQPVF